MDSTPLPGSTATPNSRPTSSSPSPNRPRADSRLRKASIAFTESRPPLGMWQATGEAIATAPSLADIRRGSFGSGGWTTDPVHEGRRRSVSQASSTGSPAAMRRVNSRGETLGSPTSERPPVLPEQPPPNAQDGVTKGTDATSSAAATRIPGSPAIIEEEVAQGRTLSPSSSPGTSTADDPSNPNHYIPPPKHTWGQATVILLKSFWKFFITPLGFVIVIYCLNVVAWGGMLFLLLLSAAPAMCHPSCGDINSPRRKWIEIDSQILNALFCVTGFGLIPWRFRDLYFLLRFRWAKDYNALRRLAGIHRSWFRLPGSDKLDASPNTIYNPKVLTSIHAEEDNPALPFSVSLTPDPPLTGVRAPPTKLWKLDFVIWMYVLNTFLQAVLSGFMWGYNRYTRPSWSTGLFVALACIVAGVGGLMAALEGKRVKKIEGVPWSEEDLKKDMEKDGEATRWRKGAPAPEVNRGSSDNPQSTVEKAADALGKFSG